jgi:hypothetical protein
VGNGGIHQEHLDGLLVKILAAPTRAYLKRRIDGIGDAKDAVVAAFLRLRPDKLAQHHGELNSVCAV